MFHTPNIHRLRSGLMHSDDSYGNNGAFQIPILNSMNVAYCIASDGDDWEHVSVHVVDFIGKSRIPTWEEMCMIKNIFWDEEDCVVQYHPPKSQYVNNHPHVLHLWRSTYFKIPMPPSIMVGIK